MQLSVDQLRIARRSCGLTQNELAEESGLARNTVTLIESGASDFRVDA
jgi:DNA-binding XRE family transcriptional regulator